MRSREFIAAVVAALGDILETSTRVDGDEARARVYGTLRGDIQFGVWHRNDDEPGSSAWSLFRGYVASDVVRSTIANPEDVAGGIIAWHMRLTRSE